MRTTLVDSNVLLDYLTDDSEWLDWSTSMLADAGDHGGVAINPIIYAEVSGRFDAVEDVEAALPADYFARLSLPLDAAFLAGRVCTFSTVVAGERNDRPFQTSTSAPTRRSQG